MPLQQPKVGGMFALTAMAFTASYYEKNPVDGKCAPTLTRPEEKFFSAASTQISDTEFAEATIAP
jgi:hypothetical protein